MDKNSTSKNKWPEYLNSCVLMHENGQCAVSEKYMCSPGNMNCAFHTTLAEKKASEEKWRRRMNSLPTETQELYAQTYYGDKMPWKGQECPDAEDGRT